jgi:aminopeptidase N
MPGNFQPQVVTTKDFIRIANEESGRDLGWFFNVYLYRAKLPKLESERRGGTLQLRWDTPDNLPFPMPVDIMVDGQVTTLPMANGRGTIPARADSVVTLDPHSKILMQSDAIDRYQAWQATQPAAAAR